MLSYIYIYTSYLQGARLSSSFVKLNIFSKISEVVVIFVFAWFLTQDKYSKSRFKLTGEIPASLKLLDDPDIFNDEYANAFIQQAKLAEAMPSVSEMHEFWLPFSNQLLRIFKGKIPVAEGLQEVVYDVKSSYQK